MQVGEDQHVMYYVNLYDDVFELGNSILRREKYKCTPQKNNIERQFISRSEKNLTGRWNDNERLGYRECTPRNSDQRV